MAQIRPATHEVEGHLRYGEHGLGPYWALSKLYFEYVDGDDPEVEVEIDGETWSVRMRYHKSGIAPQDRDSDVDRLYEWDIVGRGRGERKASFTVSPRFEGMRHHESGEAISVPFDHLDADEGLSVTVQGSNVDYHRFPDLLPAFVQSLGREFGLPISGHYFQRPILDGTAGSTVYALERYVRVERETARKVIRSEGPMHSLAMHLSAEGGCQGKYEWDNEERVGHYHTLQMSPADVAELAPSHRYGKQVKHYLLKDPDAVDEEDPTYHPKVGALFHKRFHGSAVPWGTVDEVVRELDETLVNVLTWADVPTEPGGPTYVQDDHFEAAARDDEVPVYADPTPELEAETEHLLVTALSDLTESDQETLEALADGGKQHVEDLSAETDYSLSTIYRVLDRIGGVIESEAGYVQFTSQKIAEDVRSIVDRAEHAIETGAERIADLYNLDVRQAASSAFQKWAATYGAEVEIDDDRATLRIDTVLSERKSGPEPQVGEVLHDAIIAWKRDGRDPLDLRRAIVEWTDSFGRTKRTRVRSHLR